MLNTIRRGCIVLLAAMLLSAVQGGFAAAEVIDRVLAVVSGSVITLSDARGAVLLGLVDVKGAADPTGAAVTALIDHELVLEEVNRSVVPEPDPALVTQRIARIHERFADPEAYRSALAASGLDEAGVHQLALEDVRVTQYINRRFEAVLPPSDDEILAYYRSNQGQFTQNGVLLPLDDVRSTIVGHFVDTRRAQAIESWLARLRRRADVVELYLPGRQ